MLRSIIHIPIDVTSDYLSVPTQNVPPYQVFVFLPHSPSSTPPRTTKPNPRMSSPEESEPLPSDAPTPPGIPHFDPATFVLDDIMPYDPNIFVTSIKQQVQEHIFAATQTQPPQKIAEALADRIVSGHFKYHDPDRREFRYSFNNLQYSQLQDTRPLLTLTEDAPGDQRIERALVRAITTYLRLQDAGHSFTGFDLHAVNDRAEMFLPQEQASAYITELVHVVFHSVSGHAIARASAVTKLVAGVPSTLPGRSNRTDEAEWVGGGRLEYEVDLLYWMFLGSMVLKRSHLDERPIYSAPGLRWKTALMAKIALWILSGSERNIFDVANRFVDLDFAHNSIESGLALSHPILGSAIVSPMSGTVKILHEMAGCVQERKQLEFKMEHEDLLFQMLHDSDKGISYNILGIEGSEDSMVSMGNYFPKGELTKFFDSEAWGLNRVLISNNGIVLYLPKMIGPWADFASSKGDGGRDPMKLVLRLSDDQRNSTEQARTSIENKSRRMQTDWLLDCPVSEDTKKRFRYIINKPGRALVRRTGIRGSYGRIIAAIVLVCGATVTGLNFAGRDNWLERIFDGAQVASLLAAVTVAVIFLSSGTLVDTLDLLAGKTEVQDVEQICALTGLTIEELQGVLTYARGTLYWLSEHRASYCRAKKLGPIVMTPPLNVAQNPETKHSFVADDEGDGLAAVWILQGRLSTINSSGAGDGTMRVDDIPFESRLVRVTQGDAVTLE